MTTILQALSALVCFFFGGTIAFTYAPRATGCVNDLNGVFPSPEPLILRPGVTYDDVLNYEDAFILPDTKDGLLHLNEGETIHIVCPGNTLSLTGTSDQLAICKNNMFQVSNLNPVPIEKLSCRSNPTNSAVRKDKCALGATGIELGFQVDVMYPLIYTCFDENKLVTYWSKERVSSELKGYESGEDRPSFKPDDFFPNLDVDKLYGYDNQVVAFTKILGSQALATKYLKDRNQYFLARGHFVPRADFVFGVHTLATFHFVNVAPQWQIFNGGVWNNLEMEVRDYAISKGLDLVVYTGPWAVLQYPDINGNLAPLYLANPGTASQTIQVPKFYWKLVYEPSKKRGVVFVGINDPYVSIPYPNDYVLCPDVLRQLSWLKIQDTTWLYACQVEDFVKLSETFPQVQVSGLLDN